MSHPVPLHPAVIVRGLTDARAALLPGAPVTLLSPPGAALYAGCGWWRALMDRAHAEFPATEFMDLLDCADGSAQALAALRIGQHTLVLDPAAPGWDDVAAIAQARGGCVLPARPPALDLRDRRSLLRLHAWLAGRDSDHAPE